MQEYQAEYYAITGSLWKARWTVSLCEQSEKNA